MSFIRKIVNSNILSEIIDIPESLKNKKVEVLVFSLDDNPAVAVRSDKPQRAKGILMQYKNIALIDKEPSVWEEAVKEKYEHR